MTAKTSWDQRRIESAYESAANCFWGALINIVLTGLLLASGQEMICQIPSMDAGFWNFILDLARISSLWTAVFIAVSFLRSYCLRRHYETLRQRGIRPFGLKCFYWVADTFGKVASRFKRG